MLKILLITSDFPPMPGGIAIFLENLCQGLTRLGHEVEVLALRKEGHEDCARFDQVQPYAVHRYDTSRILSSVTPVLCTWRHTRCLAPDVLLLGHVMSTHGLGAVLVKKLLGVPYVVLSHGADLRHRAVSRVDTWAICAVLRNASLLLANSRFTSLRLRETGCVSSTMEILHPGVDPGVFCPEVPAQQIMRIRQRYGLGKRQVILTVGRLVPKKNHIGVLRALPQVLEKVPEVCYLVVGDGEERPRLEQAVRGLGLDEVVIFAGQVRHEDLGAYYGASDLLAMPSTIADEDFESFGIVFAEAGACGKPVIGGRSGGMVDAVIDGETGLLVDPESRDEISAAIARLLQDKELARRLGANGRRRAVEELNWSKVMERLGRMLTQVVQIKPHRP